MQKLFCEILAVLRANFCIFYFAKNFAFFAKQIEAKFRANFSIFCKQTKCKNEAKWTPISTQLFFIYNDGQRSIILL